MKQSSKWARLEFQEQAAGQKVYPQYHERKECHRDHVRRVCLRCHGHKVYHRCHTAGSGRPCEGAEAAVEEVEVVQVERNLGQRWDRSESEVSLVANALVAVVWESVSLNIIQC
jgi:hypothetical protein